MFLLRGVEESLAIESLACCSRHCSLWVGDVLARCFLHADVPLIVRNDRFLHIVQRAVRLRFLRKTGGRGLALLFRALCRIRLAVVALRPAAWHRARAEGAAMSGQQGEGVASYFPVPPVAHRCRRVPFVSRDRNPFCQGKVRGTSVGRQFTVCRRREAGMERATQDFTCARRAVMIFHFARMFYAPHRAVHHRRFGSSQVNFVNFGVM